MLDERKLAVLRAIVQDYVSTEEPVGSKTLVERHNLGVSPATIRNDMAVLEEEGYIAQPHTSAGRVPTDKGYRLFVDRLAGVRPLTSPERRAIQQFLDSAINLDDVVDRTVRLLAQLTRQVAVVQYPSLSTATVRHLEVLSTGPGRVMLVLITDTGRVEQRVVDVPVVTSEDLLPDLRARLNAVLDGQRLSQAADAVTLLGQNWPAPPGSVDGTVVGTVIAALREMIDDSHDQRVVMAGAANLTRAGQDFTDSLGVVLEALEEQVVLMRLLHQANSPDVSVRIGHENSLESLAGTSVVASGYGHREVVARLGVIGPTRMDYPGTMGAVRAVARYVGHILSDEK
ncbi:heat-inducible transcriptional repressor HrcA [Sporichthya polymorpha]|uniref:heat-inducible transcriptional repressor HrcA n=1 Tax=Sporichthya polymorpha TaxID=35751 RepID=UPI0003663AF0|nr:heat-inducible transcriptional repressor HrcA [Sporichthya polymorpha]